MEGLVVVLKNQDHTSATRCGLVERTFTCRLRAAAKREALSWNGHRKERSYVRSGNPATSDTRPVAFPGLDPGFANEDGVPTIRIML